jgi:hypothetical protein
MSKTNILNFIKIVDMNPQQIQNPFQKKTKNSKSPIKHERK